MWIQRDWWENQISQSARDRITARLNERLNVEHRVTDDLVFPHRVYTGPEMDVLYHSYIESFDYHEWFNPNHPMSLPDIFSRELTAAEKTALKLGEDTASSFASLHEWVESVFETVKSPLFMKLSGTSGKNEKPLYPLQTSAEVMRRLQSVDEFRKREYDVLDKRTDVILMPWRHDLDPRYEFRVFRFKGKTTGASQQHWSRLYQYSSDELESIERALLSAKFDGLPGTMVTDVWIDIEKQHCHLIECNVFGCHSGAGSSLFRWLDDADVLHGRTNVPELRYQSILQHI